MRAPAFIRRLRANVGGYFWLPCPACGQPFGGQEVNAIEGHMDSIPSGDGISAGRLICPPCARSGIGDRMWALRGVFRLDP